MDEQLDKLDLVNSESEYEHKNKPTNVKNNCWKCFMCCILSYGKKRTRRYSSYMPYKDIVVDDYHKL